MRKKKKCPNCPKLITMGAKMCQACNSYAKVGRRNGYNKGNKPINPMFLVRGNISDTYRGYALDMA